MRLLALLLLCASSAFAAQIDYVYDGDTIKIVDGVNSFKLRISDIDAPERNQSYGKKSRRALMQFCQNANITYQIYQLDKYQRSLGKLQCNQQDVSQFMVANGHAWFYSYFSNDVALAAAQQHAQANQLGLWKTKNPKPPWEWRKAHKNTHH